MSDFTFAASGGDCFRLRSCLTFGVSSLKSSLLTDLGSDFGSDFAPDFASDLGLSLDLLLSTLAFALACDDWSRERSASVCPPACLYFGCF